MADVTGRLALRVGCRVKNNDVDEKIIRKTMILLWEWKQQIFHKIYFLDENRKIIYQQYLIHIQDQFRILGFV